MTNLKLVLPVAFGLMVCSCLKVKEYPVEPSVEVLNITVNPDTTITLLFQFTDGDGDIGLAPGDTHPPFNADSKYYQNLFVKYYEKKDGAWVNTTEAAYRVQPLTPKGRIKVLEGEMDVKLFYDFQSPNDTMKFSVQLVDKALHESNVSESPEVIKP